MILSAAGIGYFFWRHQGKNPLLADLQTTPNFPLYYPTLPTEFTYKKGSGSLRSGVVFFAIEKGDETTLISEQAAPTTSPPKLDDLKGFTKLAIPAGNAVIGANANQPVAIILSNTTLITINGQANTPSDVVSSIAKNMSSL